MRHSGKVEDPMAQGDDKIESEITQEPQEEAGQTSGLLKSVEAIKMARGRGDIASDGGGTGRSDTNDNQNAV
jgi:hypothetical protein